MNKNELSTSIEVFITIHNLQIIRLSNINKSYYEHNIVYKMINKLNGKHYIGQHVTKKQLLFLTQENIKVNKSLEI